MYSNDRPFNPDQVEEQLDQLVWMPNTSQPDTQFVKDLYLTHERMSSSPEQLERSLAWIWNCLETEHMRKGAAYLHVVGMAGDSLKEDGLDPLPLLDVDDDQFECEIIDLPEDETSRQWFLNWIRVGARKQPNGWKTWKRSIGLLVIGITVALMLFSPGGLSLSIHQEYITTVPGSSGSFLSYTRSLPLSYTKAQTVQIVHDYYQEVESWGKLHTYTDPFNDMIYPLDYAYGHQGIGVLIDAFSKGEHSRIYYRDVVHTISRIMFNLRAMELDYSSPAPWNKEHASDQLFMNAREKGQILFVSLLEQALRVYQNGQLVKAFKITSGRYEMPSIPIVKSVNMIVKSIWPVPKDAYFKYPRGKFTYALACDSQGSCLRDQPERHDYGPQTNFPHRDLSGNPLANDGSAGGIEMPLEAAHWLFDNASSSTTLIIY